MTFMLTASIVFSASINNVKITSWPWTLSWRIEITYRKKTTKLESIYFRPSYRDSSVTYKLSSYMKPRAYWSNFSTAYLGYGQSSGFWGKNCNVHNLGCCIGRNSDDQSSWGDVQNLKWRERRWLEASPVNFSYQPQTDIFKV